MRRELVIAAISLLSVIALLGWTRTPVASPAANLNPAGPYVQPVNAVTPYGQTAFTPYGQAFVPGPPAGYLPAPPAAAAPQAQYAYAQPAAPTPVTRTVVRRTAPRTTAARRSRPMSHSVAIVAGSSGAGAAIGALAGGGKGAAIGALAGGAGGFIYDRITRNR